LFRDDAMINAFIFDMDGTLLDSEIIWGESIETYLGEKNHPISHEEALALVYGRSWHDIYEDIIKRFPDLDIGIKATSEALRPFFLRLGECRDIRIAGSIALLKRLSKDYRVCIVSGSGSKEIVDGIALMGIEEHVSFFLSAEHYSPGKPDPACFLMAAEKLGLPPSECLVFEDSSAGIQGAKSAGMHCVALVQRGRPPQDVSRADLVLNDLSEFSLEDYLGSLRG